MTGEEHYQRAEALLDSCRPPGGGDVDEQGRTVEGYGSVTEDEPGVDTCRNALMAAQVHATLALTSALRGDHLRMRYVAGIGESV